MKTFLTTAILALAGFASAQDRVLPQIIPMPALVEASPGYFEARQDVALIVASRNAEAIGVARDFQQLVKATVGLRVDLRPTDDRVEDDAIVFTLDPTYLVRGDHADEGYELTVASRRISVIARTPRGLYYGSTTLWQLLSQRLPATFPVRVADVHISDTPRFAWRGLMLDSARHFQSPRFIKQLIEWMSLHKLNTLHWHLTDDQGWRLQIKRYPKLTEIGAWRTPASVSSDGEQKPYGGFYTQDEVRDIVRFAAAHFVTIVPEIDMPGHAQAAIAAYPELGVTGAQPQVSHDWGVHTWLYNVDETTFTFVQNVLAEVIDLFPGAYVHIGGDEAAKDQWKASVHVQQRMREIGAKDESALQSYFIKRMQEYLSAHGRKLVGWDEILEGGLAPDATVMSWQGEKGAIEAAKLDHDVVLAPSPVMYFDHLQSDAHDEPAGRPEVISLADVYAFEPVPKELTAAQGRHVLGGQANLWSEYLASPALVEHAAFPRVAALAEALWSAPTRRDWSGFLHRLPAQLGRYRALGIDYSDAAFAPSIKAVGHGSSGKASVALGNPSKFGVIRYTLEGKMPNADSPMYVPPLELALPARVKAATFDGDTVVGSTVSETIDGASLRRRNSDTLKLCKGALPLRLVSNPDGTEKSQAYRVDIMDACWIYPRADLTGITRIRVHHASVPNNFQLWHDAGNVVQRPAVTPYGELQMSVDGCDKPPLARLTLSKINPQPVDTDISPVALSGSHDLCFSFTARESSTLRVIDWIELLP